MYLKRLLGRRLIAILITSPLGNMDRLVGHVLAVDGAIGVDGHGLADLLANLKQVSKVQKQRTK